MLTSQPAQQLVDEILAGESPEIPDSIRDEVIDYLRRRWLHVPEARMWWRANVGSIPSDGRTELSIVYR